MCYNIYQSEVNRLLNRLSSNGGSQEGLLRQKEALEMKHREMEQVVASVQRRLNAEKAAREEVCVCVFL
jgi:hypothetical protein